MAIKRTISKAGCCGGAVTIIFYLDKVLTKNVLSTFENAGWIVPPHYVSAGIFYVRSKESLVANTSFGTTKINVKCSSFERDRQLDEFEKLLEQGLNNNSPVI